MNAKAYYYSLLVCMAVASIAGDWFFVAYAKQKQDLRLLLLGFLCCNLAFGCFVATLFSKTLFGTVVNYDVISTVAIMAISIFFLREKIALPGFFWGAGAVFCVWMMQKYLPE